MLWVNVPTCIHLTSKRGYAEVYYVTWNACDSRTKWEIHTKIQIVTFGLKQWFNNILTRLRCRAVIWAGAPLGGLGSDSRASVMAGKGGKPPGPTGDASRLRPASARCERSPRRRSEAERRKGPMGIREHSASSGVRAPRSPLPGGPNISLRGLWGGLLRKTKQNGVNCNFPISY